VQQLDLFRRQFVTQRNRPGKVAAGSVQTGDKTSLHGVVAGHEDDGNRRGRCFDNERRRPERNDHGDLTADQFVRVYRKSLVVTVSPAVFDLHIAAIDIASLAQPEAEGGHIGCVLPGRRATEKPHHRHRLPLLRVCRERPCRRAAEKGYELAPQNHSISSSAIANTPGGMVRFRAFAALRLITSSNLIGWKTGKSAGLSPLRMRPA